jgi:hypothetical protein
MRQSGLKDSMKARQYEPALLAMMDETMLEIDDNNKRSEYSRSFGKDSKFGYVEFKKVRFHMTMVHHGPEADADPPGDVSAVRRRRR